MKTSAVGKGGRARTGLIVVLAVLAALVVVPAGSAAADPTADLGVTNVGPETTTPDADVAYVTTVQNFGPDSADAVTLTNDVPAGATFVSLVQDSGAPLTCSLPADGGTGTVTCTVASFAAGDAATLTLTVHVDAATPLGSFITDQPRASSATFDPDEENDTATQSTLVGPVTTADVGVTLLAPEAAAPDVDVTSSIAVQNGGPDPADVTLVDTLPGTLTFVSLTQTSGPAFSCSTPSVGAGGTITCDTSSMPAGASATFDLVAHVPPGTASGDQETSTASVTTTVHDPNLENDAATTTTTIGNADMAATASGPASVVAGATVSYTLTVTDNGPDAAGAATLAVTLPANTRFVSLTQDSGPAFLLSTPAPGATGTASASRGLLASGASAQFTLVLAVDIDTPGGTTIATTATASASTGDPDPADDSATVTTTATAPVAAPAVVGVSPPAAPAAAPPAGRRLICTRVPDLRRHTLRGARFILARDGCAVPFRHLGHAHRPPSHVLRQSVKPGTSLYAGDELIVRLR